MFSECRLRPLTLVEVDITLAVLGGSDVREVDFTGCRFRETSLVEADARKAVFRGAAVDASLWTTAKLAGARIDVAQALAYAAAHGLDVRG